ncbi:hypothetical protein STEG23_006823 [Scotinomys teguina]
MPKTICAMAPGFGGIPCFMGLLASRMNLKGLWLKYLDSREEVERKDEKMGPWCIAVHCTFTIADTNPHSTMLSSLMTPGKLPM